MYLLKYQETREPHSIRATPRPSLTYITSNTHPKPSNQIGLFPLVIAPFLTPPPAKASFPDSGFIIVPPLAPSNPPLPAARYVNQ